MTVEMIMVVTMLMKTQRKRRMKILAITGQCITNTPLKMRTSNFAFSYGKFYSTWVIP
jgi:hypothetical protein